MSRLLPPSRPERPPVKSQTRAAMTTPPDSPRPLRDRLQGLLARKPLPRPRADSAETLCFTPVFKERLVRACFYRARLSRRYENESHVLV